MPNKINTYLEGIFSRDKKNTDELTKIQYNKYIILAKQMNKYLTGIFKKVNPPNFKIKKAKNTGAVDKNSNKVYIHLFNAEVSSFPKDDKYGSILFPEHEKFSVPMINLFKQKYKLKKIKE